MHKKNVLKKHKKMRKNVFNTLFYFSKMDKNKCPKLFLKKKFQKTGIFCFFWLIYYFIKIIKTSPKITILVLQPPKFSFLYGVKASFFTPSFQKIIILHHNCFGIDETLQKDPYHLCSWWFYTIPFKKLWKSQLFPRFFHFFAYGLIIIFTIFAITIYHNKMRKKGLQKKTKKNGFFFFNTLFYFSKMDKNKCPKKFLKKKFQKTGIFYFFSLIHFL